MEEQIQLQLRSEEAELTDLKEGIEGEFSEKNDTQLQPSAGCIIAQPRGKLILLRGKKDSSYQECIPQCILAFHSPVLREKWLSSSSDYRDDEDVIVLKMAGAKTLAIFCIWLFVLTLPQEDDMLDNVNELYQLAESLNIIPLRQQIASWSLTPARRDGITVTELRALQNKTPPYTTLHNFFSDCIFTESVTSTRFGKPRAVSLNLTPYSAPANDQEMSSLDILEERNLKQGAMPE
jgi:hypothetical protein